MKHCKCHVTLGLIWHFGLRGRDAVYVQMGFSHLYNCRCLFYGGPDALLLFVPSGDSEQWCWESWSISAKHAWGRRTVRWSTVWTTTRPLRRNWPAWSRTEARSAGPVWAALELNSPGCPSNPLDIIWRPAIRGVSGLFLTTESWDEIPVRSSSSVHLNVDVIWAS